MTSDLDMRRLCEWCGKELAEDRPAWTLCYDTKCRNAANYELERVARIEAKAKRPRAQSAALRYLPRQTGIRFFARSGAISRPMRGG